MGFVLGPDVKSFLNANLAQFSLSSFELIISNDYGFHMYRLLFFCLIVLLVKGLRFIFINDELLVIYQTSCCLRNALFIDSLFLSVIIVKVP